MNVSPAVKLFAFVVLALAATIGGFAMWRSGQGDRPSMMQPLEPAPSFILTASDGAPFNSASLKGKVVLIFFGFTHCPDVCPTTMALMSDILSKLGAEAGEVVPVFITVDPERDTPEALKAFRASFDNRIIMLSGTPDEINTVIADYHIYAKKVPLKDGNYTMDHTASVFLFDRQLRLRSSFDFHEPDKVIFDKVRLVLDGR